MDQEKKFGGRFRIRDIVRKEDRRGQPYSQLHVSGSEGPVRILAWDGRYSGPTHLRPGMIVNITGKRFAESGAHRCETIVVLEDAMATRLYRDAGRRLKMIDGVLVDPALGMFLKYLLKEAPSATRFLTEPASLHHHHSGPHGLFIHSVDVAMRLFEDVHIESSDKPLAVMLGLAHDLGKLWESPDGVIRAGVHHDKFTIAMLDPILKRLSGLWPGLTADLAQVFCLRQDRVRHSGLPRRIDVLQEALRHADRLSCAESWISSWPDKSVEAEGPLTKVA